MMDPDDAPDYGAYCPRCDRAITQPLPSHTGAATWIRCHSCDVATPAYRNRSGRQVQNRRENGKQSNLTHSNV